MKRLRHQIVAIVLILVAVDVQAAAAEEQPVVGDGVSAAAAMAPIDIGEITIAGEIGRRIDITAYKIGLR